LKERITVEKKRKKRAKVCEIDFQKVIISEVNV